MKGSGFKEGFRFKHEHVPRNSDKVLLGPSSKKDATGKRCM